MSTISGDLKTSSSQSIPETKHEIAHCVSMLWSRLEIVQETCSVKSSAAGSDASTASAVMASSTLDSSSF